MKNTTAKASLFTRADYREVLRDEFDSLCKRRPQYSMRAFARDLNFNSATLSEVLRNKKGISRATAAKISAKLGFDESETEYFTDLVIEAHGRSAAERARATERLNLIRAQHEFTQVELAVETIYEDWPNLALLELVEVIGGGHAQSLYAAKLGVDVERVGQIFQRLQSSKLLSVDEDGCYHRTNSFLLLESPVANASLRKFHKGILNQAVEALETQQVEQRKAISAVFSISKSSIAEARNFLNQCQEEFFRKFVSSSSGDAVYALGLNLFRLDKEIG